MSEYFIIFVVIILALAALLQADFVLTLFYFAVGTVAVSRWWSVRALKNVRVLRTFDNRAFVNDRIAIRIDLHNAGRLPVVWLRLHDSLPTELIGAGVFRQVVSLGPRANRRFEYTVQPARRGYYQVGPLFLHSGDLLGLNEEQGRQSEVEYLTVYPKIIPLTNIGLPSRSPMGTLRHHQPIFEDPSRVRGKRDYAAGDSLRRVDWKATAVAGRMQVKLFEPSIALETAIFLDLDRADYYYRTQNDATELGIVVAASIANWITAKKQTVGFVTNGADILSSDGRAPLLPPEKGRGHLMRILDVLARIQTTEHNSFVQLLRRERVHLVWGATVILITGNADQSLFEELFQSRRAGLNVVLILCGHVVEADEIRHKAEHFGIPIQQFTSEQDLDVWRR
ncbi:MAG: DUF58 domain-containing protein [Chloroflexi bacterium]|nr:DUF58 domain-containing protein [Chloroflexota bacterium]MCL5274463.1 DUF58 domain-containing protein [Chloroflexota bacterium]